MRDRIVRVSSALVGCVLFILLGAIAGGFAQNPPAPSGTGPQAPPAPPKASIEGTITKAGTGQALRDTQIALRRPVDANQQNPARGFTLAGGGGAAQLGALQDLMGAVSILRGGAGGMANLNSPPALATAVTDKQGHFVITDVEPGDYIISAERDGYIRKEYGQRTDTSGGAPVTLSGGKRSTIDFQLVPAGVIAGRVVDGDGSPVTDARVQAYTYRYSGGRRSLAPVANAQTNDLGEYRLHPLTAGTYFISVTPRDGLPTDQIPTTPDPAAAAGTPRGRSAQDIQVFMARGGQEAAFIQAIGLGTPPIYYPGVLDPTESTPVRVVVAGEVRGIDFNLRPIRTVKVSGRVETPFELPSEQARREAIQNMLPGLLGGRGAAGQGGFSLQGGALITAPRGDASGGQRGQGATTGTANNPLGILGNLQGLQNLQNVAEPVQVRFSRIGAESQSPLAALIGNGPTPVNPDGTFQIENVTSGSYNLTAIARDQKGVEYTARTRVEVGTADINGLTIIPRPGVDVRGQIYTDSTPPDSFKPTQLRVSLVSDDNPNPLVTVVAALGGDTTGGLNAPVEADGNFVLKNAGALPYRVRVTGLPSNGYVVAARFGDIDPLSSTFSVGDTDTLLQVQVGFSSGTVNANVVDGSGKPFSGIVTALVPDAARRGRADLFFSGASDTNGKVIFANVPPGTYRLFAWEEVPAEAFRYAEFLQGFEDRGVSVNVEKNGAVTLEVKAIPKAEN